jgi:hypothetical protein
MSSNTFFLRVYTDTLEYVCGIKVNDMDKDSNRLIVYHPNPLSLSKKKKELSISMQSDFIRHLICLSEHHLREQVIIIHDFRFTLHFECCMFSFGLFSSVWSLIANILEHPVCSIFIGEWVQSVTG